MAQRRKSGRSRIPPQFGVVTGGGAVRPPRKRESRSRAALPGFPVVIQFARGRVAPRAESLTDLHRVGEWLSHNEDEHVTVVGHANQRSNDRAAAALARARVATVVDLVVLLGAARSQLVDLRTTRLHSLPVGSTLGARRQRRVVVLHRHSPTGGIIAKAVRELVGGRGSLDA